MKNCAEVDSSHPSFTRARNLEEPLRSHFPKSMEEAQSFVAMVDRFALAHKVLVVARTRVECAWCAYIDAVPGVNHDIEKEEVLRTGTKLLEEQARVLFPQFNEVPYAR